jgi:hypothetical protein
MTASRWRETKLAAMSDDLETTATLYLITGRRSCGGVRLMYVSDSKDNAEKAMRKLFIESVSELLDVTKDEAWKMVQNRKDNASICYTNDKAYVIHDSRVIWYNVLKQPCGADFICEAHRSAEVKDAGNGQD